MPACNGVAPLAAWCRKGTWIMQVVEIAPLRNVFLIMTVSYYNESMARTLYGKTHAIRPMKTLF
jgi:hypothetical protein